MVNISKSEDRAREQYEKNLFSGKGTNIFKSMILKLDKQDITGPSKKKYQNFLKHFGNRRNKREYESIFPGSSSSSIK